MTKIFYIGMFSVCVLFLSACDKDTSQKQGYFEGRFTYISSQATGVLQSLAIQRGQSVKQGQLLFQLQDEPNNFAVESAKALYDSNDANLQDLLKGQRPEVIQKDWFGLEAAKAQYIYAKQTLERQHILAQADNTAMAQFNEAQQNYKVTKNNLKQAEQQIVIDNLQARIDQIESAKAVLDAAEQTWQQQAWLLLQKTAYAPADAFVYDTFYYPGEVVPANSPVMALLTPQNTYALFYVTNKELATLKLGALVTLNCDGCQEAQAKISYIAQTPEYTPPVIYSQDTEDRMLFRVEAIPVNTAQQVFHPGEGVMVSFHVNSGA